MHTRKRGKAKSHKPINAPAPTWVKQSKEEIIEIVVKLASEGKRASDIGQTLRDQYGIPSVKATVGKTTSQILDEKKMNPEYPDDLLNLIRKAVGLRKHLKENTRDTLNKQKLIHIESKIRRLVLYYQGKKLPEKWSYNPEQAALIVK